MYSFCTSSIGGSTDLFKSLLLLRRLLLLLLLLGLWLLLLLLRVLLRLLMMLLLMLVRMLVLLVWMVVLDVHAIMHHAEGVLLRRAGVRSRRRHWRAHVWRRRRRPSEPHAVGVDDDGAEVGGVHGGRAGRRRQLLGARLLCRAWLPAARSAVEGFGLVIESVLDQSVGGLRRRRGAAVLRLLSGIER